VTGNPASTKIPKSDDWRVLKAYGGVKTIEEFRKGTLTKKNCSILKSNVVPWVTKIEEIWTDKESNLPQKLREVSNDDGLRLKRSKPLQTKSDLFSMMDLNK